MGEVSTATKTLFAIFIVITVGIFLPLYVYWNVELFNQRRSNPAIHVRYYPQLVAVNFFAIVFVCVSRPVAALRMANFFAEQSHTYRALYWIDDITYHFSSIGGFTLVFLRFWSLFFAIKWKEASEDQLWVVHFNPKQRTNNLYLDHRKTLGSKGYMFKRGIFAICVAVFFVRITESFHNMASNVIEGFYLIGLLCALGVIGWKMPAFTDAFAIRTEIRYVSYLGVGITIFFALFAFIIPVFSDDLSEENAPFWVWCLGYSPHCIFITAYEYITIKWVLKKNANIGGIPLNDPMSADMAGAIVSGTATNMGTAVSADSKLDVISLANMKALSIDSFGSVKSQSPNLDESDDRLRSESGLDEPRRIGIDAVLCDRQLFNGFMAELYKEFSSENLLCVTEISQFQLWCVENMDNITAFPNLIELPKDVSFPKSDIVFEDTSIVTKVGKLCHKYILTNAEFEVNIRGHTRKRLIEIEKGVTQLSEDELAHCFDTVIDQLLSLLRGTFERWQLAMSGGNTL